jgi:hypothetical protein
LIVSVFLVKTDVIPSFSKEYSPEMMCSAKREAVETQVLPSFGSILVLDANQHPLPPLALAARQNGTPFHVPKSRRFVISFRVSSDSITIRREPGNRN